MSQISSEYERVQTAFAKPTLRLLDKTWAPVIIAVFSSTFSREETRIDTERFHSLVGSCLDELASLGHNVPDNNPRLLCRKWVKEQWLIRDTNADDPSVEEYTLTWHSQEALNYVSTLTRDRSSLSESRIITILETARRVATEASPNPEERVARIQSEIDRLTSERDYIAAGGEMAVVDSEQVLNGYLNLADLINQLPADFKRYEDFLDVMFRALVADFRSDTRPRGEAVTWLIEEDINLRENTSEGRAFKGVVQLLRSEQFLADFSGDIATILAHDFTEALTAPEIADMRGIANSLLRLVEEALSHRHRITAVIRDNTPVTGAPEQRELEHVMRDIEQNLVTLMKNSGPRTKIEMELVLPQTSFGHTRERFYNPDDHVPPPPLLDVSGSAPEPISAEELRQQGGPTLSALRLALVSALSDAGSTTTTEVFASLPDSLRRPVEALGMQSIVAYLASADAGETGIVETVRPDGSRRSFVAPELSITLEHLSALNEAMDTWGSGQTHD